MKDIGHKTLHQLPSHGITYFPSTCPLLAVTLYCLRRTWSMECLACPETGRVDASEGTNGEIESQGVTAANQAQLEG